MKVIINADDLGLHPDVNAGIIDAYRYGMVTSASLMVNFETSARAARMASAVSLKAVGLHFNVTSGHCVARESHVPSLVDSEGWFRFNSLDVRGSMARWRAAITCDSRVLDEIEREFWAQIERFVSFGLEPTHLDMHHYLPLIHTDLFAKFVSLADELGVQFRGLCYPMIDMLHVPQGVLAEMKAIMRQSGFLGPEISLSNLLGGGSAYPIGAEKYERIMQAKLQSLIMEGVNSVELITHPARMTEAIRLYDDYVWARELETALVNSSSFKRFLERSGCPLVAHTDLE